MRAMHGRIANLDGAGLRATRPEPLATGVAEQLCGVVERNGVADVVLPVQRRAAVDAKVVAHALSDGGPANGPTSPSWAEASRRPCAPWTGRSRSPACSSSHRACPRGRDASPRARTHPLVWMATCPPSHPLVRA